MYEIYLTYNEKEKSFTIDNLPNLYSGSIGVDKVVVKGEKTASETFFVVFSNDTSKTKNIGLVSRGNDEYWCYIPSEFLVAGTFNISISLLIPLDTDTTKYKRVANKSLDVVVTYTETSNVLDGEEFGDSSSGNYIALLEQITVNSQNISVLQGDIVELETDLKDYVDTAIDNAIGDINEVLIAIESNLSGV